MAICRKSAVQYMRFGATSDMAKSFWGALRQKLNRHVKHREDWLERFHPMSIAGNNGYTDVVAKTLWPEPCSDPAQHFPYTVDPQSILSEDDLLCGLVVDQPQALQRDHPRQFCMGARQSKKLFLQDNPEWPENRDTPEARLGEYRDWPETNKQRPY